MKEQRVFIFMGNSGCGKGTQTRLLQEKLESAGEKVLKLETGNGLRDFWKKTGYSAELSRDLAASGSLQPEFLATNIWSEILIEYFNSEKHLIADGVPRRIREAKVLDGALKFYGIKKPTIIYLDISEETARERMLGRGRSDDSEDAIKTRLRWFKEDVVRTLEFLKADPYYEFLHIDAEQSVDDIHQDVLEKLDL